MILWSFQHPDALSDANNSGRGYLTGNTAPVDDFEEFRRAYDFMREQMAVRIPNFSGDLPVWAWPRKPDLRRYRHKEPTLLLRLIVPSRRVVLSDFDAFNIVLNNGYYSLTENEDAQMHRKGDPGPEEKRLSWARIFDLSDRTDPDVINWCGKNFDTQACIDRVFLNEIVEVRPCALYPVRRRQVNGCRHINV